MWMNLQAKYELAVAEDSMKCRIEREVLPRSAWSLCRLLSRGRRKSVRPPSRTSLRPAGGDLVPPDGELSGDEDAVWPNPVEHLQELEALPFRARDRLLLGPPAKECPIFRGARSEASALHRLGILRNRFVSVERIYPIPMSSQLDIMLQSLVDPSTNWGNRGSRNPPATARPPPSAGSPETDC